MSWLPIDSVANPSAGIVVITLKSPYFQGLIGFKIRLTGIKGAIELEDKTVTVTQFVNDNEITADMSEVGINGMSIDKPTKGGAIEVYQADGSNIPKCKGAMRLAFSPNEIATITSPPVVGSHVTDNLKNHARGLISRIVANNHQTGDRKSLITVSETDTNVAPSSVGTLQDLVNSSVVTTVRISDQSASSESIIFVFDRPVNVHRVEFEITRTNGVQLSPDRPLLETISIQGLIDGGGFDNISVDPVNVVNGVDLPFVGNYIQNNGVTGLVFESTGKYTQLSVHGIVPNSNAAQDLQQVVDIVDVRFYTSELIDITLQDVSLTNCIVIPEIKCDKNAYLGVTGKDEFGVTFETYYKAIAPTFSQGEYPHKGTVGLTADGYYDKELTSVFVCYPPPMFTNAISIGIYDAGGEFEASMILTFPYHIFDGAKNFDIGNSTNYDIDQNIESLSDGSARVEKFGVIVSRSMVFGLSSNHDSAQVDRATIAGHLVFLDSFPKETHHKRNRNRIIGYISDTNTSYDIHSQEIPVTIIDSKKRTYK